ncbi:STAS domain-containing protein [Streptomyces erythrochromogenes]|uniref:STAS domain-containing protein n=1 Tax=Streptomyces erythrochromogenes TaxID=285574 RepID=UPI0038055E7E
MINLDVQHCGSSILISATGELDKGADEVLQRVLDRVTMHERELLVDLHAVEAMDIDGLLHLLSLHRRAEGMRLRVLVTGWQPQPQQCMATVAGIPGPRAATGERYALAGFRRLLEEKAQRARDHSDFADGWLSHV